MVVQWTERQQAGACTDVEFGDEEYNLTSLLFHSKGMCGKIEVIAVTYVTGDHYCSSVRQALSAAKFLHRMHEAGFVHGDLRGLNLVFNESSSEAIDFDFGGADGKTVFPMGYVDVLPDGYREISQSRLITQASDVSAFLHILNRLHFILGSFSTQFDEFYLQSPKTMQEIVAKLEEGDSALMVPDPKYKKFLDTCSKKAAQEKKVTLDGSPITPQKTTGVGSKRSREAAE